MENTQPTQEVAPKIHGKTTFVDKPLRPFPNLFNNSYPLDLSIQNYCLQNCPFCFANLSVKARAGVVGKSEDPTNRFIKQLQKANGPGYNPQSLVEFCMHHKYAIVFSNNVDPFQPASEAKFKIGERVLRACIEENQPVHIQTKEVFPNETVRDLIIDGKKIFNMYVSISTLDYETAKKYETVAVPPRKRLERIAELTASGVKVCVALNPYAPEWQPNLDEYFKIMADIGVSCIYTDPLHFTRTQAQMLSGKMKDFAKQANSWDRFFDEDVFLMEKLAKKYKLGLYYQNRMPMQDFYCGNAAGLKLWPIDGFYFAEIVHDVWLENGKKPVIFKWKHVDQFYSQFEAWNNVFSLSELGSIIWLTTADESQARMTLGSKNRLKTFMRYIFNNPDSSFKHRKAFLDYWALRMVNFTDDQRNYEEIEDESGDAVYVYHPPHQHNNIIAEGEDGLNDFVEFEGFED